MNTAMKKVILTVEDNLQVQHFNRQLLESHGFTVHCATTLAEAREMFASEQPNAIILDIGMPDGSGLDFLRELRRRSRVPVLMLTGYGGDDNIVLGFESGCNDYLPKPYTFEVLLVRLQRLLKSAEEIPQRLTCGSLSIDVMSGQAFLMNKDLVLTQREFSLLLLFAQNEGRVMSVDYIYENIWGQHGSDFIKALPNTVHRLRKKIAGSGYDIVMERGHGYCFELE